jgi:hypothetical protein
MKRPTTGKEVLMRVRSLLVKGVVAGALAVGSLSLTAGAAHADNQTICTNNFYLQGVYYEAYQNDWSNYQSTVGTAGGEPAADYYYDQYQMDYSTYQYYTSRVNGCLIRVP